MDNDASVSVNVWLMCSPTRILHLAFPSGARSLPFRRATRGVKYIDALRIHLVDLNAIRDRA